MDNFKTYAQFYDLLYQDKNYIDEVIYIDELIKNYAVESRDVLDLGCGTGKHSLLMAQFGYQVCGIDASQDMLNIANQRKENHDKSISGNLGYICSDIRNMNGNQEYDVIVSLFHVMSYQITEQDIYSVLNTVNNNLKKNGLFIFDFWYGPAVLKEKPHTRVKKVIKDNIKVTRIAEPLHRIEDNIVEILYTIYAKEPQEKQFREISELHKIRYFFREELEMFLSDNSLDIINCYKWMTKTPPGTDSWSAVMITRKNCN